MGISSGSLLRVRSRYISIKNLCSSRGFVVSPSHHIFFSATDFSIVGNMTSKIISGRAQPNATVSEAGVIYKTFRKLSMNATLSDLADALDFEPYGESCLMFPFSILLKCIILVAIWTNLFWRIRINSFGDNRAEMLRRAEKEKVGKLRWRTCRSQEL
jgi:hypothetical protein